MKKTQIAEMSWLEFRDIMTFQDVIIIPVGANAVHGAHNPLGVDAILAREMAKRIGEEAGAPVSPLIPMAANREAAELNGTISFAPMLVRQVVWEVCESYIAHGAKRFFFVNGSEGNCDPLKMVCADLQLKYDDVLGVQSEWWKVLSEISPYACEDRGGLHETSALLYVDETLCDMDRVEQNSDKTLTSRLTFHSGLEFSGVRIPACGMTMGKFTGNGCFGPSAKEAGKEVGAAMFDAYVDYCARLICELRKIHL